MDYLKVNDFKSPLGILFYLKILAGDLLKLLFFKESKYRNKLSHLDIEPTNICNANCVFCGYQYQKGPLYKTIDLEFVRKILDAFCNAGGGDIGLTPIVGDPLVNKDLEQLIRLCKAREKIKSIGMTTNGILLTKERFISLQEAGLTDLVISMTYPDKDEYEKIYRTSNYEKLVINLNDIMDLKETSVKISLGIRTPRLFLGSPLLFKRAKALKWKIIRNIFFDDWIGTVTDGLIENELVVRPARKKHLPCTMLQSGPHVLASKKITACGCRDLEGKSELSDENLFAPFYEHNDFKKVYYENMETLRKRFLKDNPPSICTSCHHYNPDFEEGDIKDTFIQVLYDFRSMINFIFNKK